MRYIKKNKLMKKFILMIAFGFISNGIFAQVPLKEGEAQLNAGLGFSGWGVPVYVGVDFGLVRDVTLGGQLSFQTDNDSYHYDGNKYDNKASAVGIGINGNYHFNRIMDIPSNFDFYAGASVTYYIWDYKNDGPHTDNDSFGPGVQVGGRYFFNEHFGLNLELAGNTGTSGGKFGITYKF